VLVNKNKMLYQFDGANGVKTGYTKIAGRCLVSGAERGGMQLVSVVLNCHPMYERSAEILEQCFAKYSLVSLFEPKEMTLPTEVKGKSCRVEAKEGFSYPLAEGELSKVQILFDLPEQVKLPVKCGDALGEMQILLENQLLFSQKIVSIENVKKSFIDILRDIANN
jgi:serine-type D-ala-D-ala carboxypeptidase